MTFHATGTINGSPATIKPLMPAEDAALNQLKVEGVVTHALLSTDRAQVFLLVTSNDEPTARTQLDRLPLTQTGHLRFALQEVTAI